MTVDDILASRRQLPIDPGFLSPKSLDTLFFPQHELLSSEKLKLNVICTAEVLNEALLFDDDDIALIMLDLTTIKTSFRFVQGF